MLAKCAVDERNSGEITGITQVNSKLMPDGKKARIEYRHPNDSEYLYCFIFEITEEEYNRGISLNELLESERDADIIDRRTPHDHYAELSQTGIRCVLYPARYDAGNNTYFLVNQKENNVTNILRLQPTIQCNIRYEAVKEGFFKLPSAKIQKAIIKINGNVPGVHLIYCCKGGGREKKLFGIDAAAFGNRELEIIIKKEEKIEMLQPQDKTYILKVN